MSVKNDVSYVKELCNSYGNDEKRIYFSTNEKLQELFSKVNFGFVFLFKSSFGLL